MSKGEADVLAWGDARNRDTGRHKRESLTERPLCSRLPSFLRPPNIIGTTQALG